jgi:glycosyltransferase involved in cell wall biosynthesis
MSKSDTAATGSPAPILFVHWGDEGIRGSERVLLDLLSNIDRDLYAPLLWCNTKTLHDAVRALGLPARVSRMPILLGWDRPRFDARAYWSLVREGTALIRDSKARLVHVSSGAPNQWMVPAARSMKVPLIAHLHAVYGFRERCTLLLDAAPIIVGCSEATVSPFRRDGLPDARLRVIHNGVDPTRLGAGTAAHLRASLGMASDSVLIVGVGALVPLKGFDVLLRALGVLRSRATEVHVAIVGEGPELDSLKRLAHELALDDRVHFLGQRSDVGAILRDASDIVAIPSRIEAFGLVAAEAAIFGRPAVATAVGGIGEIVQHAITGLLVPSGDHVAFAAALERVVANPDLRQKLGESARDRVLGGFVSARVARSFERLYSELTRVPRASFSWSSLGLRVSPFARLAMAVAGRRLGLRVSDA